MVSKEVAKMSPTPSTPHARERREGEEIKEPAMPRIPPIKRPATAASLINF
jgi:hypothetical protein